jgi:broad specificity phosphatase PhoE
MIYIIRHGQTEMNQAHALQGRSDQPLNENGIRQAQEAGKGFGSLRFDRVYSSPLGRAIQTAEIVAPGVPIVVDDRLIEMDYGPYEGVDLTDMPAELIEFFRDFVHNPAPEGMEQLSSVVKRTGAFIEEIKDLPGNTLISTHAIAMKGILEYLTPDSGGRYWSKHIGNCAVYAADNKNGHVGVPSEWEKN